jgi:hypothetical protein
MQLGKCGDGVVDKVPSDHFCSHLAYSPCAVAESVDSGYGG